MAPTPPAKKNPNPGPHQDIGRPLGVQQPTLGQPQEWGNEEKSDRPGGQTKPTVNQPNSTQTDNENNENNDQQLTEDESGAPASQPTKGWSENLLKKLNTQAIQQALRAGATAAITWLGAFFSWPVIAGMLIVIGIVGFLFWNGTLSFTAKNGPNGAGIPIASNPGDPKDVELLTRLSALAGNLKNKEELLAQTTQDLQTEMKNLVAILKLLPDTDSNKATINNQAQVVNNNLDILKKAIDQAQLAGQLKPKQLPKYVTDARDAVLSSISDLGKSMAGDRQNLVVAIARHEKELGVTETNGDNLPHYGNNQLTPYALTSITPASARPWCGSFAQWVYHQAGFAQIKGALATDSWYAELKKYGHVFKPGSEIPQPGDIALINNSSCDFSKYPGCHVAIVYKVQKDSFIAIEGNVGNSVQDSTVYSFSQIAWFGRMSPGTSAPTTTAAKPNIDTSKILSGSHLATYTQEISALMKKFTGVATSQIQPRWIVLHTTEGNLPSALSEFANPQDKKYDGDAPGAISTYLVNENTTYQMLPDGLISGGAYGLNHSSYSIEMVGKAANKLSDTEIHQSALVVVYLMQKYNIPFDHVISHQDISDASDGAGRADIRADYKGPLTYDGHSTSNPNGKPVASSGTRTDPGQANMTAVQAEVQKILGK